MGTGQLEPTEREGEDLVKPTQVQNTPAAPEEQRRSHPCPAKKCEWFSNSHHLPVTAGNATLHGARITRSTWRNLGRSG